ncbi:MAG: hypothetical protein DI637_07070 [Citromicrobium sp.]|nr:MAG: hypothetical protein DI637_07070 [Citromicrobium sp.]
MLPIARNSQTQCEISPHLAIVAASQRNPIKLLCRGSVTNQIESLRAVGCHSHWSHPSPLRLGEITQGLHRAARQGVGASKTQ